jgi:hypothetical protein
MVLIDWLQEAWVASIIAETKHHPHVNRLDAPQYVAAKHAS